LLPTGNAQDTLHHEGRAYAVSLIDAANACVFLDARDLGLIGTESPDVMEADPARMALLDALRRQAGVMMGLAATPERVGLALPKIAVVAPPAAYRALDGASLGAETHDIAVRMISMERAHRAVPLTGAMCLGVASRIPGSLPHQLARPPARADETRVAYPSGILSVGAEVREAAAGWHAESAVVYRSARRLMQGAVAAPAGLV
jgi:2-methylaconitate cis-trans-isomerase PrpF